MSGHQFIHLEVYARSRSKLKGAGRATKGHKREANGKVLVRKTDNPATRGTIADDSGGWSARQIVAEALREVGNAPHVARPLAPEELYGDLRSLARDLDALDQRPPVGVRKDSPILLAGMTSAPWPSNDPRSTEWRMDCLVFLKEFFGTNLLCVVGHNDENHTTEDGMDVGDHIHFYAARPGFGPAKPLQPGFAAREDAKKSGLGAKEQAAAYNTALRHFQDLYFEKVAMRHGLTRIGPGRRRLTRADWVAEKQQAESAAQLLKAASEANRASKLIQAEAETFVAQAALARKNAADENAAADRHIQEAHAKLQIKTIEAKAKKVALEAWAERLKIAEAEHGVKVDKLTAWAQRLRTVEATLQKQASAFLDVFNMLSSNLQHRLSSVFSLSKRVDQVGAEPRAPEDQGGDDLRDFHSAVKAASPGRPKLAP